MSKPIAKIWTFRSTSGNGRYETLLYRDGTTSCNCPGWTRRTASDNSRTCKHVRFVAIGSADRECEDMHDYRPVVASKPRKKRAAPAKKKEFVPGHVPLRDFTLDYKGPAKL